MKGGGSTILGNFINLFLFIFTMKLLGKKIRPVLELSKKSCFSRFYSYFNMARWADFFAF